MMEVLKSGRGEGAWQPNQNQAFLIVVGGLILAGVLAWLL